MVFTEDTIGEFFEKQVERYADKEFIVYPDRDLRFTYREFNERVNLLAKGLLSIGIGKGDHVGIWATNVPDWLTFLFATAKIGAVLVTVNTAYKSHELEYVMKQSDMKAIAIIDGFRDVDYVQTLYELVPELRTHERGHLRSERFPELRSVIYIGAQKHRGMYNTNELMLLGKHVPDTELRAVMSTLKNTDVINMQYTSGTTGFPKGVMLTHRNILNNGYYIGERQRFTEEDRLCLPVPLFHCFGIVLGVLALLTHGGTLVMIELFDPLLVLAAVEKERCTALYGVPTMFIAEFTHPMFDMFDLSSLRTGIMAGSPCPIEAMKRVMNDMNMKDNVMKGYYKMPEMTAEAIDEDGWLHSGDLAVMDEDGYYSIVGRIKDMIIRGGENIYPREIEEFLHTMPENSKIQGSKARLLCGRVPPHCKREGPEVQIEGDGG